MKNALKGDFQALLKTNVIVNNFAALKFKYLLSPIEWTPFNKLQAMLVTFVQVFKVEKQL